MNGGHGLFSIFVLDRATEKTGLTLSAYRKFSQRDPREAMSPACRARELALPWFGG